MLFTSGHFLLLFLPMTLIGYFAIGRWSSASAIAWVFLASVFFYGYWMPEMVSLLLASIAINFGLGRAIARARLASLGGQARLWLSLGIAANLLCIAYFKYANFFVSNLSALLGTNCHIEKIILPIGISFYTFTQIAFLVDTYQEKVRESSVVHYGLFVTYFPHLVAGPVLHHAQMMPQFAQPDIARPRMENIAAGLLILSMGMFKKVVLADGIAPYADVMFRAADANQWPNPEDAWLGALAYTLQLYFDFSGYSDMAIGLSRMFNVQLPYNFNSPYRAGNISEFWRRWHMSLSTFLRDYLYVPLGGNRNGPARRYLNLMATMVLGGLWHGASWTFVAWGTLHGAYLMFNHGYRAMLGAPQQRSGAPRAAAALFNHGLTLLAVVVAWVFFRAETFGGAHRVLSAMFGQVGPTSAAVLAEAGLANTRGWMWCAALAVLVLAVPNSNLWGERMLVLMQRGWPWRALASGAALAALLLLLVLNAARDSVSAFIYFNF